jgi:hypothetical protein
MDLPKLNPMQLNHSISGEPVKSLKLWPDQTEEKAKRVKAEGDFSMDSSALRKKYREVLMGRGPSDGVERREIEVVEDENLDQALNLNENQLKLGNEIREKLMEKAKVVAKSAMKMDGDADLDPEGYRNVKTDAQAFRASQNGLISSKRVRFPLTVSHDARQNHGVLKRSTAVSSQFAERQAQQPSVITPSKHEESKRANAPAQPEVTDFAKKARGKDVIHETILKRDDLTLEIGKLFLRIVGTDLDLVSSTASLTKPEESKKNGQVLILKEMQKVIVPTPEQSNESSAKKTIVEPAAREEVKILAAHLGKVFVDIGLTLPSGHSVEDARKNDIIAKNIGSRAIQNCTGVGGLLSTSFTEKSDSQKALKNELIATAIGRILMHLRGYSQVMTARMESPSIEQHLVTEDKSILALGRLTLQMIEQSAMSDRVSGKIGFETRKQGEGFIRKLGLAVFKGASALVGSSGQKPSVEDARRPTVKTRPHNQFSGQGVENAKSFNSEVETARKLDSRIGKASSNLQSILIEPNRPISLEEKQPVKESRESKMNVGNPSIDTLPTRNQVLGRERGRNTKSEFGIHLPERTAPPPTLQDDVSSLRLNQNQNQNQNQKRKETFVQVREEDDEKDEGVQIKEQSTKTRLENAKRHTKESLFLSEKETRTRTTRHEKEIDEPQPSVWKQKTYRRE